MKARGITTVAALAVAGVLLLAWIIPGSGPATAYGQIPDAGAQREVLIHEMQGVNAKLTEVISLLRDIKQQTRDPNAKPLKPGDKAGPVQNTP